MTADTTFWSPAWGGDGANGNVCCNFGGQGGQGGYAQTTMSVSTLEAAFGTTELYYYVGVNGTVSANAGGGAAARPAARCNDRTSRRR